MSQNPDDENLFKYNLYCSTDGKRDFARGVYGAILLPLKAEIFKSLGIKHENRISLISFLTLLNILFTLPSLIYITLSK